MGPRSLGWRSEEIVPRRSIPCIERKGAVQWGLVFIDCVVALYLVAEDSGRVLDHANPGCHLQVAGK